MYSDLVITALKKPKDLLGVAIDVSRYHGGYSVLIHNRVKKTLQVLRKAGTVKYSPTTGKWSLVSKREDSTSKKY